MADIETRLGKIEDKLDIVAETLARMANQGEQIATLWKKLDDLQRDNITIQKFQASCPRTQLSIVWGWLVAITGTFGILFIYHVLGVKP